LANPIDTIQQQAALWAARSANEAMKAEHQAEREAWLAADRRHQGAYLRACAVLHMVENAVVQSSATPAAGNDNAPVPPVGGLRSSRWPVRLGIGGAAIAACAAGLLYLGIPARPGSGIADTSVRGDMALADGSTVTLGEGGRISAILEKDSRNITLQSGEATFHVAKDRARPFIVQSGDVYAQATGTIYTVHRLGAAGGEVRVTEGSVLVWARDRRAQAVLLKAGQKLALDPATLWPLPRQAAASRPAASQSSQFSFDNISIAAAAARFNQVNRTQIVIADPAIGNTPIIGLFDANDPEQFAQAVAVVAHARVVAGQGSIVIEK
jgi:transmembrane sensor